MNSIGKISAQMMAVAVTSYVCQYLCHLYLANLLSPGDYGDFAVAISSVFLLSTMSELAASRAIPSYFHRYEKKEDTPLISGLFRTYLIATFVISLLVALAGGILNYLDFGFTQKVGGGKAHPLILALWFLPFLALSNILVSILKCISLNIVFELPRQSIYGFMLLFLLLFSVLGFKENDWWGITIFGFLSIVIFVVYLIMTFRLVPHHYFQNTPQFEWPIWLKMALPIMVSNLLFRGMKQVDLLMVEGLDVSEGSVGYFSVASQTAQGMSVLYLSMSLIYAPMIVNVLSQGNAAVKKTLHSMTRILSGYCLIFFVGLIIFGKSILGLFGPDYLQAYPTMILLAAGACLNTISGGYTTFLQYSGRQNYVMAGQIVIVAMAIGLNIILIPRFGMVGAGLSTLFCFGIMGVFFTVSALRILYKR